MTKQRELPILMNQAMVKATMRGDKRMTRRPANCESNGSHLGRKLGTWGLSAPPWQWTEEDAKAVEWSKGVPWRWNGRKEKPDVGDWVEEVQTDVDDSAVLEVRPEYLVGDLVYVRETWRADICYDRLKPKEIPANAPFYYEANGDITTGYHKRRPALLMPKRAARIWLEITGVRCEQVQSISEADALAEGVRRERVITGANCNGGRHVEEFADWYYYGEGEDDHSDDAIDAFEKIWDGIYGCKKCKGHCVVVAGANDSEDCPECTQGIGNSWRANPVVFVYEFKIHERTKR